MKNASPGTQNVDASYAELVSVCVSQGRRTQHRCRKGRRKLRAFKFPCSGDRDDEGGDSSLYAKQGWKPHAKAKRNVAPF